MDRLVFSRCHGMHQRSTKGPAVICELVGLVDIWIFPTSSTNPFSFRQDRQIGQNFRSKVSDYENVIGWRVNKSHMSCVVHYRNNRFGRWESFYLSNILPMTAEMNQGIWKDVELYIRICLMGYEYVRIFTGPIYLPR